MADDIKAIVTDEEKRKRMLSKLNSSLPSTTVAIVDKAKENFDADYEYTRKKLKNLADRGEEAIEHFAEIAKETNEPRAFEVLATLLKNTGELVKGVIDNAEAKSNIDRRNEPVKVVGDKDPTPSVNNTTIFVGTTKDLLDKIKAEEQRKIIDVEPS